MAAGLLLFGRSGRETFDLERLQSGLEPTWDNAALIRRGVMCAKLERSETSTLRSRS